MERYAGIDLASEEHRFSIVDGEGGQLEQRRIGHDEQGIAALCRRLRALGVGRVALERPDGLVVERLLDAGLTVVAVHPNQLAAARDRYRVAGGKSDGFDSYVLAELCRTDMHRLRALEPDGDETKALRALTRTREDLVQARVALANQLRAQLEAFWPGALVFAHVDSPVSLAFSCARSSRPSGRARGASSASSTRRSPSPSSSATPARSMPAASARSGCRASSRDRATAAARARPSCSRACARRPRAEPASSSSKLGGRPCSAWSPRSSRWSSRSSC